MRSVAVKAGQPFHPGDIGRRKSAVRTQAARQNYATPKRENAKPVEGHPYCSTINAAWHEMSGGLQKTSSHRKASDYWWYRTGALLPRLTAFSAMLARQVMTEAFATLSAVRGCVCGYVCVGVEASHEDKCPQEDGYRVGLTEDCFMSGEGEGIDCVRVFQSRKVETHSLELVDGAKKSQVHADAHRTNRSSLGL